MKIEKINDKQIRCTLTREDLDSRNIRLSELAYGTEKAKKLFNDMMQQAQELYGFEADNMPIMIEAVPLNPDNLLLIVTKVEDPEELDTRFSKFSPVKNTEIEEILQMDGADNIIDLFKQLTENKSRPVEKKEEEIPVPEVAKASKNEVDLIQLFRFRSLDDTIRASKALDDFFEGRNSLYKDPIHQDYCLILHQSSAAPEHFNKICNILSEYGSSKSFSSAGEAHFLEHADIIIPENAISQLASL